MPGPGFWRAVEAMEELGYDSLWLSDTATRPGPSPLPVLAAVAARTERLKIGTSVLVAPYGARLAHRLKGPTLRRAFAVFLIAIGAKVAISV